MPLQSGPKFVSANIRELIQAGYDRRQAAAIAYRKAGMSQKGAAKCGRCGGGVAKGQCGGCGRMIGGCHK